MIAVEVHKSHAYNLTSPLHIYKWICSVTFRIRAKSEMKGDILRPFFKNQKQTRFPYVLMIGLSRALAKIRYSANAAFSATSL